MPELKPEQISALEEQLQAARGELEELVASFEDGAKPVSLDQPIGRLSRMDALQQQSMSEASRRVARQRLEQVKAALHRITSGDYGYCVECEEEIDLTRLQARPEAVFCIDCQGRRERSRG